MVGPLHDEQKPQRKERRKDDSHRGALIDLTKTADPLSKDGRQNTHYSRANKHRQAGTRTRHQKGNRQAREHRMANGIAHHTHFTKHEEIT